MIKRMITVAEKKRLVALGQIRIKGEHSSGKVWLNGKFLTAGKSLKIRKHSLDGFNWGYGGSGPSQLALAIMLELSGDPEIAYSLYQDFKWKVIAPIPQRDFDIVVDAKELFRLMIRETRV